MSIVARLTGIDDVYRAVENEDWVAAERLAGEFSDYLRLLQDLGWGEAGTRAVITAPPDLWGRALSRLNKRAEIEEREEAEERDELARRGERVQLVREICSRHLAELA